MVSTKFPCIVGHEIVGKVLRVGSQADNVAVGDVVSVGYQADSYHSRYGPCEACENQTGNYCPKRVSTYNSVHQNGNFAQGGYALYHRYPASFVAKPVRDRALTRLADVMRRINNLLSSSVTTSGRESLSASSALVDLAILLSCSQRHWVPARSWPSRGARV
ncbi:chaperonin 10-like protein [Dactylonectria estremocensis]|uniref:Chaperonin 10-like protein n=1 Tax=Dactylonectria estremocensis TaxID=1079267 RepID=A0A9P9IXT0_9HYPO|nr:chaperonin 10-like protein [Dactylonectria estremocensis]